MNIVLTNNTFSLVCINVDSCYILFSLFPQENDKPHLDNNTYLGMSGFFDLYEKQATRLDMGLHDIRMDLDNQGKTTSALKKQLSDLEASGKVVDENR